MLRWLSRASIGLSTMVDEHFGINIVEFMVRISLTVSQYRSFLIWCAGRPRESSL